MNSYSGKFVSLEGVDGSGTSTAVQNLYQVLDSDWCRTQEPSVGRYGRMVREGLQSDDDPTVSDFFMFCADRFDHCNSLIGPRLEAGENVLTDRYNLSTYAYQSPILEKELDVWDGVKYIDEMLEDFIIEPDLTILFDIPVEEALKRKEGDEKEKYEKEERLKQTRSMYRQVANDKDYVEIIDARQEEQEIMWKCYDLIEAL